MAVFFLIVTNYEFGRDFLFPHNCYQQININSILTHLKIKMSDVFSHITQQIAAIKDNDEKTLREFYVANFQNIERFILKNSGTIDDAKDLYQEAFLAFWRNIQLDKFSPQKEQALQGYLFQIAKNKWLDTLRSRNVRRIITMDESKENKMTFDEDNDIDTERIKLIQSKFRLLGQACKELLIRFYYRKQSTREIAIDKNWTEPTAKNNKYRCMEQLRALINNNE